MLDRAQVELAPARDVGELCAEVDVDARPADGAASRAADAERGAHAAACPVGRDEVGRPQGDTAQVREHAVVVLGESRELGAEADIDAGLLGRSAQHRFEQVLRHEAGLLRAHLRRRPAGRGGPPQR
jgi:hypothetical protein